MWSYFILLLLKISTQLKLIKIIDGFYDSWDLFGITYRINVIFIFDLKFSQKNPFYIYLKPMFQFIYKIQLHIRLEFSKLHLSESKG
jgi:hypothetical protein